MPDSRQLPPLHIDVTEAHPLDQDDAVNQLEELLGLRELLTRLMREAYHRDARLEELEQTTRNQFLRMAESIVGIVDELRRLIRQASAAVGPEDKRPTGRGRLFGRRRRRKQTQGTHVAVDWIHSLERSIAAACDRLETLEVYHIDLPGKDLHELAFEGQRLKGWVSVGNKPTGQNLVVEEELQGLWVARLEGQIVPVQRGKVLVK